MLNSRFFKAIGRLCLLIPTVIFHSCDVSTLKNERLDELKQDTTNLRTINVTKQASLLIDSLFDEPTLLPLETNRESMIGKVDKVIYEDNLLFIVDRSISNSVFVFDQKGRFLNKIHRSPDRYNEYLQISDIVVNSKYKRIELLDQLSGKTVYYDYRCAFIKSKKIQFTYSGFVYLSDTHMVHYTGRAVQAGAPSLNGYMLTVTDSGKYSALGAPLTPNQVSGKMTWDTFLPPLWKFGNDVFFNPTFSDMIYRVKSNSLEGVYKIKGPGVRLSSDQWRSINDKSFSALKKTYHMLNGNFVELHDYAYFGLSSDSDFIHAFYSKRRNKIISGSKVETKNPLLAFFHAPVFRVGDNKISCAVSAHYAVRFYQSWKSQPFALSETNRNLLRSVKPNDNPIIFFFTFKKF